MSESNDPVDTIKAWQEWYKSHRLVAEMDEPQITKDSRENLHNTSNAINALPDWRVYCAELIGDGTPFQGSNRYKQKATDAFADTIAEFFNEMSGEELFNCFKKAARQNLEYVQKEYDDSKDLMDLLEGKVHAKK